MTEPSPSRPTLNIVIACGGTGGHLFPGIAVAQELKKRGHNVTLLISQKKVDAQASKNYGDLNFRTIEAIAMPKIPSMSLLGFGLRLYKAIRFSRSLLDEVNADVVIGMGGFTSFPPRLRRPPQGHPHLRARFQRPARQGQPHDRQMLHERVAGH